MTGGIWHYNTSDDSRLAAYRAETEYEKASWLTLYDLAGDRDVRIPAPFQIGAVFIKIPEVALDLAGWHRHARRPEIRLVADSR